MLAPHWDAGVSGARVLLSAELREDTVAPSISHNEEKSIYFLEK